jgi:cell pole-organizing protein PopZ
MSAEPSMEEILSSIKRIIAEEGEGTQTRGRRPRAAPQPIEPEPAEVLELSDPILESYDEPEPEPAPAPRAAAQPRPEARPAPRAAEPRAPESRAPEPRAAEPRAPEPRAPEPRAEAQPTRAAPVQPAMSEEPILSHRAAAASLGSLETLSKLLVKPEPESDGTLEGLVREMLRPMLRDWLDQNLPDMVETLVAREITKITSQMR